MTSGPNLTPRGYNIVNDPTRFNPDTGHRINVKDTRPQITVFDDLTDTGTFTSAVYPLNNVQGFSITKTGGVNVVAQVSPDSNSGIWFTLTTLSANPDTYSNNDPHVLLRFQVTNPSSTTVILHRKYATY